VATTFRELALNAVTTGTSAEFDATGLKNVELYAEWSVGCSAGTVMLESAARKGASPTGFWMNEGTTNFSASNTTRVGVTNRAFGAVRARISNGVVGGTVDVYITGN
jgi:hypothetical protein